MGEGGVWKGLNVCVCVRSTGSGGLAPFDNGVRLCCYRCQNEKVRMATLCVSVCCFCSHPTLNTTTHLTVVDVNLINLFEYQINVWKGVKPTGNCFFVSHRLAGLQLETCFVSSRCMKIFPILQCTLWPLWCRFNAHKKKMKQQKEWAKSLKSSVTYADFTSTKITL